MSRLVTFLLGAVLLLAAPSALAQNLYVCNQGEATVHVVDMQTRAVVDTVDLKAMGFSANAKPHHAVAEPDGSFWYLSLIGENVVLKLTPDHEIVGRATFETPGMLAIHPTDDLLLVGRSMSAVNPPKSLGIVTRSDMSVETVDTFFPRPHALTVAPNGAYVYSASLSTNQMLALDVATREVELTRFGGATQTLVQFAATPDGNTLVAGGQVTGQLLFFDASNAPTLTVVDTVDVGAQPWHPVISPDGSTAYVPLKAKNAIAVVDLDNRSVTATITGDGLAQPHGSVLSPDGRYLFVSNNNRVMKMAGMTSDAETSDAETSAPGTSTEDASESSSGTHASDASHADASHGSHGMVERPGHVVVVDTETNEIVDVIEVGVYPTGIGTHGGQASVAP